MFTGYPRVIEMFGALLLDGVTKVNLLEVKRKGADAQISNSHQWKR